jgi:pyruvate ferredoxin oxidoreductase alpha subunit
MSRRAALEASHAVAEAVKMADVDVISAYPITPQTHIPERLAEMVANGELKASYIPVESEHTALSACLGSVAVGARSFTTTASQGLELMHEVVYCGSSMRLPMVMVVCNRSLSAPISVWGDHSDVMSCRDTGWIQVFCENSQQAFDMTVWGYRVAEDLNVRIPVMVNLDGFTLSHVTESLMLPEQSDVDKFLPPFNLPNALNPDKPTTHGALGPPDIYTEAKVAQEVALRKSKSVILQGWKEFGDIFGRYYSPVESYKTEGAKTLLLTLGSYTETAKIMIDKRREQGEAVGLINIRLWRPFPFDEFKQAVRGVDTLITFDRSISFGMGGPVFSEAKSALYAEESRPKVVGLIGGLGGRDVSVEEFEYVLDRGKEVAEKGSDRLIEVVGVRGEMIKA